MMVLGIVTSLLGINQFYAKTDFESADAPFLLREPASRARSFHCCFPSQWPSGTPVPVVIDNPSNETERWLVETVRRLANKANIGMPEVPVYEGEPPNAFATGAFKIPRSLPFPPGLLQSMSQGGGRSCAGARGGAIQNGDMVTLTCSGRGQYVCGVPLEGRRYFVDRVVLKMTATAPGIGYCDGYRMPDCLWHSGLVHRGVVLRASEFRCRCGQPALKAAATHDQGVGAPWRAMKPS